MNTFVASVAMQTGHWKATGQKIWKPPKNEAFIVKSQHRRIRRDYLKKKNAKLVWEETIKDKAKLKEYAQAMDLLSRQWKTGADGIRW